jgi:hypothetical protein
MNEAAATLTWLFIVTSIVALIELHGETVPRVDTVRRHSFQPLVPRLLWLGSVVVVAVRPEVVRIEVAVVVPVPISKAVPVPTEVTAAAITEGETAPHTGSASAEMDSTHSAGATETQSSDTTRAPSAEVAATESTHAAHVAAAEPPSMAAAAKPAAAAMAAAAMAAASTSPAATARLCRGCNSTGERAGDENDHHLLQHLPIPHFGCRFTVCGWSAQSDARPPPAVFCPCRALLTVAAI